MNKTRVVYEDMIDLLDNLIIHHEGDRAKINALRKTLAMVKDVVEKKQPLMSVVLVDSTPNGFETINE